MAIPATGYDSATITNPDGALTDFSLMIDLSRMSASWWSANDTATGAKGRACKSDGSTELSCDWIDFDNGAETGWLRVKYSGTLASSGTQIIRIFPPLAAQSTYSASDTYGSDNAYASHWVAYYPLEEDPSGSPPQMLDRTSNSNNGTTQGTMVSGDSVSTQVGNGLELTTSQYVEVTSSSSMDFSGTGMYSLSIWVDMDASQSNYAGIIAKGDAGTDFSMQRDGSGTGMRVYNGGNFTTHAGIFGTLSGGGSKLLTMTWKYSTNDQIVYLDGSSSSSLSEGAEPTYNAGYPLKLGSERGTTGIVGSIDEAQVHDIDLSPNWIAEEYAQTNNNATFWGSWAWTGGGGGSTMAGIYYRNLMGVS